MMGVKSEFARQLIYENRFIQVFLDENNEIVVSSVHKETSIRVIVSGTQMYVVAEEGFLSPDSFGMLPAFTVKED